MTAGPAFISDPFPCPYCKRTLICYGTMMHDVETQNLHTCGFDTRTYKGPMYSEGDFRHAGWPAVDEGRASEEGK